jgi:3-oxoacyl-[acyl-carrier protein] reductase
MRLDTREDQSQLKIPDLAGRAVLITGASTGIGAALARAFAAQSARVAIHYNSSREAAEALVAEIAEAGGEAFALKGDIAKAANVAKVVEEAAAKLGGLDGLINNAGNTFERRTYADMTEEFYDSVMDLNARSVVFACRAAIPHLKQNGGFIINTSSLAARNGASGGMGLYGSSKAFVSNLTRGLAKELIPFGIRVNAVAPGFIQTRIHDLYSTDTHRQAALATIPQGRAGTPEDCVGAYLFLASESLSGYIVGQTIEVNGGQLMP